MWNTCFNICFAYISNVISTTLKSFPKQLPWKALHNACTLTVTGYNPTAIRLTYATVVKPLAFQQNESVFVHFQMISTHKTSHTHTHNECTHQHPRLLYAPRSSMFHICSTYTHCQRESQSATNGISFTARVIRYCHHQRSDSAESTFTINIYSIRVTSSEPFEGKSWYRKLRETTSHEEFY